jgi:hypothetical protein
VNAGRAAGVCLVLGGIMLALLQAGCEKPSPTIQTWSRTFGGDTTDEGHSVGRTADGGYIVAGLTRSKGAGYSDVWVVRCDSIGNEIWDRTYGGQNPDGAAAIQQTTDGGYIIIGSTWSYGAGLWDAWLVKTDPSGNELWNKTFGGPKGDLGISGQQTSDGGYIIAGSTESYASDTSSNDIWLIKTDPSGNESWSRTFTAQGGPSGAYSVEQTRDGGYIIAGWTEPANGQGFFDLALIKTDSSGDRTWQLTFGTDDEEWGNSVHQTADGGYVVLGFVRTDDGNNDMWLLKTDSTGNVAWRKTFDHDAVDMGNSVLQTDDGGYVLAGYAATTETFVGDAWIIRTDADGERLWDKTYGGTGSDEAFSIVQASDGGFVVTGFTASEGAGFEDMWLFKIDSQGSVDQ